MKYEHRIAKAVEFSHTDMAGIMHFSNFFRFMEAVEHDFFRSLGKSIVGSVSADGKPLGWPRVNCQCNFTLPLKFEDTIHLHLVVREIRSSSIKYEVIFKKDVSGELKEAARGSITIVHVGVDTKTGKMSACILPDWISSSISVAPENYEVK
ncbi:MAG: acyl-CoA thioesterase [Lentisphaeraceae bacterium]|nr:acyl-CoA thioesterase [Lentisphaeraceae bacterium]